MSTTASRPPQHDPLSQLGSRMCTGAIHTGPCGQEAMQPAPRPASASQAVLLPGPQAACLRAATSAGIKGPSLQQTEEEGAFVSGVSGAELGPGSGVSVPILRDQHRRLPEGPRPGHPSPLGLRLTGVTSFLQMEVSRDPMKRVSFEMLTKRLWRRQHIIPNVLPPPCWQAGPELPAGMARPLLHRPSIESS